MTKMLSSQVTKSMTRFIEFWEIKATLENTLSFGSFLSILIFFFSCKACWGYLSDSKKLAWKGEGSVCTNSKESRQKQMGAEQERSRAHKNQQGLPMFQGQGCEFTRPKAAGQSILSGWRNPKAKR